MDERDGKGGRIDREIELKMRYVGEGMKHTMGTKNSPSKENKFIHKTTCVLLLQLSTFIEKGKREVRMKRCVEVVTFVVKHLYIEKLWSHTSVHVSQHKASKH